MTADTTIRNLVRSVVVACVGLAIGTAALAQPGNVPAPTVSSGAEPAAQASDSQEYVLGPEDVVEVEVVGTSDKTRARVYTDGSVQVNLVGRVQAAGLTPRGLAAEVAKALQAGGFYESPIVNVEVVGYASRYVTVLGSVGSPGLVPINRRYRLSEILARVGGVREGAADFVVVRPSDGPEKRYSIQKLATGGDEDDPYVAAGDRIFSPAAEVFYIAGQVKAPGSYPISAGMTVAQAIAKGGGLTESGSGKKVKVSRGGKTSKLSAEEKIEPGDVLTVPERLF